MILRVDEVIVLTQHAILDALRSRQQAALEGRVRAVAPLDGLIGLVAVLVVELRVDVRVVHLIMLRGGTIMALPPFSCFRLL